MSTRAWQSRHSGLGGTFFKVRHGGVLTFSLLLWNLLWLVPCSDARRWIALRCTYCQVFPTTLNFELYLRRCGVEWSRSAFLQSAFAWRCWLGSVVRHCRSQRLNERSTTWLEVLALTTFDSKGFSSLLVAAERSSGLGVFSVGCQLCVKS